MIIKENFLKYLNLTVNEIFILNCIYDTNIELLETAIKLDSSVKVSLEDLLKKEIVEKDSQFYTIRPNYVKELFEKVEPKQVIEKRNIKDFVEEYRNLFPKGNNNNGFPYKGDKQGCIKKMTRFLKLNKEYDEDIVIKATKKYINEKRKDNYNYMHLAHYFIDKNGVSALGSFCEQIVNGEDKSYKNVIEL